MPLSIHAAKARDSLYAAADRVRAMNRPALAVEIADATMALLIEIDAERMRMAKEASDIGRGSVPVRRGA